MKLIQLLNQASKGYPDTLAGLYDRQAKYRLCNNSSDTLARFVVLEIISTYYAGNRDSEQIGEAIRAMRQAQDDLQGVIQALEAL
jgi:hypothetical protein